MKKLAPRSLAAVTALLPKRETVSSPALLITEINSNAPGGDFFEVTNFSSERIALYAGRTPASWDDDSCRAGTVPLPLGLSIAPGESMVFLAANNDVENFRVLWNLRHSVQVISDPTNTGLGSDDGVTLFSPTGEVLASLSYGPGGFTRSNGMLSIGGAAGASAGGTSEQSLVWDPSSGKTPETARYTFADGETLGTYMVLGGGTGSPGVVQESWSQARAGFSLVGAA